jgi:hypothetical protein
MGFCLLPEAEAELDEIWFYIARASGSMEIANRLIDSITEQYPRFRVGSAWRVFVSTDVAHFPIRISGVIGYSVIQLPR